jgi:hypothetical protein
MQTAPRGATLIRRDRSKVAQEGLGLENGGLPVHDDEVGCRGLCEWLDGLSAGRINRDNSLSLALFRMRLNQYSSSGLSSIGATCKTENGSMPSR